MLESIKAEQWFKDYPTQTAKLEEVMKLCETGEETVNTADPMAEDLKALKARIAEIEARLSAPPSESKTSEPGDE